MREYYTPEQIEGKRMVGVTRKLLAWCENDDCGEPIYEGSKHVEQVSDTGNRYFYHMQCVMKVSTPDEQREEN